MFFNRKFCDPLLVEDAMCADYLLLFAQTTGVVKGCTSTLRWVVACVRASPNYLVTCGSGYCFIIYSKLNISETRPEHDYWMRYANVPFPRAKKEIGDVCSQASWVQKMKCASIIIRLSLLLLWLRVSTEIYANRSLVHRTKKSFSELETFGLLPLTITDGSTLNFSFFAQQLCSSLQMKPGFYLTIKTIILKVG